jgi:hypothetical protein
VAEQHCALALGGIDLQRYGCGLAVSAWLVAVTVTGAVEETLGAVNSPEELTVPAVADQEAAWLRSLATVAVNFCVPLAAIVAL